MNIVVTGASRGIGFEIAKGFAKENYHNIIIISRNKEKLFELQKEYLTLRSNTKLIPLPFDLEKIEEMPKLANKIKHEITHIDILINNAGLLINKPFEETSLSESIKTFNTNYFSVAELIKFLLPLLLQKSNKSHVINIGSMGGYQGSSKFPGLAYYSSSKAALANLTECLAEEYKSKSIAFNCLTLGSVQTEMLAEAFPGYIAPLTAKQMANFILDFAKKGHQYFNGKIIPVSISTP